MSKLSDREELLTQLRKGGQPEFWVLVIRLLEELLGRKSNA